MKKLNLDYTEIVNELKMLGSFVFLPNVGNMGDALIAEATKQFFDVHCFVARSWYDANIHEEHDLVFSGGGAITCYNPNLEELKWRLTRKEVRRCVILPHSLYKADEFISSLDERHTLFCRDERSFYYAKSLNQKIRLFLTHDMALYLRDFPRRFTIPSLPYLTWCIVRTGMKLHIPSLVRKLYPSFVKNVFAKSEDNNWRDGVLSALSSVRKRVIRNGEYRTYAFLMRNDEESCQTALCKECFDLSAQWFDCCCNDMVNSSVAECFLAAISTIDIVITDRLHVAIAGVLMEKEVYVIDNVYGKASGVLRCSVPDLLNSDFLHLLKSIKELPKDLL